MSAAESDGPVPVRGQRVPAAHSGGEAPPASLAPPGAVDCHVHIFDPRFPRAAGRQGLWATVDDLLDLRRRLGLSRTVLVYPASYGSDNGAMLDALDQMGDSARGVAWVGPDVGERELESLHARGVRGIRLYLSREDRPSAAQLRAYGERLASRDWHIELVARAQELQDAGDVLQALPCRVVLDHFAYLPQPAGLAHPAGATLRRLLAGGRTYVKLSGAYLVSCDPNRYRDLAATARELATLAPHRLLWGTDWPHTLAKAPDKPDTAKLFDLLTTWVPDPALRHRVLVGNPDELYWTAPS